MADESAEEEDAEWEGPLDMSGKSDAASGDIKLGAPDDHWHLHAIVRRLPTDFEPYGYRVRNGSDCSCGCKWFLQLEGHLSYDWGVCSNPVSPRCGLLTFEHMGCPHFELDPDLAAEPQSS
jgi:hypothetical protein